MVAGVIHISDQFELKQESAAELDEKSTTSDWNSAQRCEMIISCSVVFITDIRTSAD